MEFDALKFALFTAFYYGLQNRSPDITDRGKCCSYARMISIRESGIQCSFWILVINTVGFSEARSQATAPHGAVARNSEGIPDCMTCVSTIHFSLYWPPSSFVLFSQTAILTVYSGNRIIPEYKSGFTGTSPFSQSLHPKAASSKFLYSSFLLPCLFKTDQLLFFKYPDQFPVKLSIPNRWPDPLTLQASPHQ